MLIRLLCPCGTNWKLVQISPSFFRLVKGLVIKYTWKSVWPFWAINNNNSNTTNNIKINISIYLVLQYMILVWEEKKKKNTKWKNLKQTKLKILATVMQFTFWPYSSDSSCVRHLGTTTSDLADRLHHLADSIKEIGQLAKNYFSRLLPYKSTSGNGTLNVNRRFQIWRNALFRFAIVLVHSVLRVCCWCGMAYGWGYRTWYWVSLVINVIRTRIE